MAALGSVWWSDPTAPEEKAPENDLQNLYVFGYACKLFRDDEKAKSIDEGKHLIPWMGDDRLMIDRYDGRGHLFDLSKYDADLQKGVAVELSEEEAAVEAACDEERYLELHTDVQEKAMYEEEEWKRYYESLHNEGYNAVGFSYEQPGSAQTENTGEVPAEEDDKFVPSEQLQLPPDMVLPETQKEHARIEKTATFIAQHGTQMEIMIKMKQARNPQFEFLNFENPLNLYYKHLVEIIKQGKYKPAKEEDTKSEQDEHGHGDQHYLHPSLSTTSTVTPLPPPPPPKAVVMPKISIHDTPYGQLIKSFKKYNTSETSETMAPPPLPPFMAQPDYGSHTPLHSLPSSHQDNRGRQPPPPGTEGAGPLLSRVHSAGDLMGASNRIVPPPPDIQPIIDRMAMYVAKNGVEFEIVVKSKKDPRFAFLEPGHMHFKYYDFKKNVFMQGPEGKKQKKKDQEEEAKKKERRQQEEEAAAAAQANRSISFSIKGRNKEPESFNTLKRPLFDYDSSDGEGEGESVKEKGSMSPSSLPDESQSATSVAPQPALSALGSSTDNRPALPPEELERKQAEERLRDKLAAAARDKLATATKEKQLQAERKRKAAMFINLLRIVKDSPLPDDGTADGESKRSPACSGSASPMPEVYEYNNRSGTPMRLEHDSRDKKDKSRSESPSHHHKKRRKKSPTPPSAYANPRRSPSRYSPFRRRSRSPRRGMVAPRRPSPVRQWRRSPSPPRRGRDLSPPRRPSRSPSRKKKSAKRSRSRSESPSSSKHKKKHKRSRSKTPKKKKKDKDRSRSCEKDSKSKDKDSRDKDKEKSRTQDKERSRSRDRDKHKHKSKDKKKDRDRSKDKEKSKEKDRSKDKKSREKDKESSKDREKKKEKERESSKKRERSEKSELAESRSVISVDSSEMSIEKIVAPVASTSKPVIDSSANSPVHISSSSSDSGSDLDDNEKEKDGDKKERDSDDEERNSHDDVDDEKTRNSDDRKRKHSDDDDDDSDDDEMDKRSVGEPQD